MNDGIFTHFIKYQAIYALIVSIIISWTLLGERIDRLEDNDIKQDAKIELNALNGAEINARLASIETSLEFIKQQLGR